MTTPVSSPLRFRSVAIPATFFSATTMALHAQEAERDLPLRYGNPSDYNDFNNNDQIDTAAELGQAQDDSGSLSTDDLSKQLSNPNSPLASLTFKQIYTSFKGDLPGASNQSSNVTLFQPTFPFPLDDTGTTNLFIRPAIAYVWKQPSFDANTGKFKDLSGWADIGYDVAVGRSYDSGWVVVGGVQGTIPTNSDVSGGQWRLGPELLAGYIGKKGFLVGFPSHQWDIAGDNYKYSTTNLEIFAGAYLPNAWTVFSDSTLTYDWVENEFTIPVNMTVRKVTKIGDLPLSVSLGVDYFVKSNDDFGGDWRATLNLTPVVNNFVLGWFQ